MDSKSNNIEFMISDGGDKVIEKRFESFLNKYQNALETSLRSKNVILDIIHLLYYQPIWVIHSFS